jgi:hypothetical protein
MRRLLSIIALLALLSLAALAEKPQAEAWNALGVLRNAYT